MMKTFTLTRPDDCHLHVRSGALLKTVLPHTARQFARAIIMPNLKPPVTTVAQALVYRDEILQAIAQHKTANFVISDSNYCDNVQLVPALPTARSD
jgi:dihydroorotase